MSPSRSGITEAEIANAVLKILSSSVNGEATIQYLIMQLRAILPLTPMDLEVSLTRPNEEKWEQKVRNIRSHKNAQGNAIYEGFLDPIEGGFKITAAGIIHATNLP